MHTFPCNLGFGVVSNVVPLPHPVPIPVAQVLGENSGLGICRYKLTFRGSLASCLALPSQVANLHLALFVHWMPFMYQALL